MSIIRAYKLSKLGIPLKDEHIDVFNYLDTTFYTAIQVKLGNINTYFDISLGWYLFEYKKNGIYISENIYRFLSNNCNISILDIFYLFKIY